MNQHEPWSELGSRMPADEAYWEALAGRISEDAAETLEAMRPGTGPWLEITARYARPLAVLASAAVIAGLALFPSFEAPAPPEGAGLLVQTLEPHNPAHLGLSAASPPRLETMLLPEGVPEP